MVLDRLLRYRFFTGIERLIMFSKKTLFLSCITSLLLSSNIESFAKNPVDAQSTFGEPNFVCVEHTPQSAKFLMEFNFNPPLKTDLDIKKYTYEIFFQNAKVLGTSDPKQSIDVKNTIDNKHTIKLEPSAEFAGAAFKAVSYEYTHDGKREIKTVFPLKSSTGTGSSHPRWGGEDQPGQPVDQDSQYILVLIEVPNSWYDKAMDAYSLRYRMSADIKDGNILPIIGWHHIRLDETLMEAIDPNERYKGKDDKLNIYRTTAKQDFQYNVFFKDFENKEPDQKNIYVRDILPSTVEQFHSQSEILESIEAEKKKKSESSKPSNSAEEKEDSNTSTNTGD